MSVDKYRKEIDKIDCEIVKLLQQRAENAVAIGEIKNQQNQVNLYDPAREALLMAKLSSYDKGILQSKHIRSIYREIVSACLSIEQVQQIAFLGPSGTFTQMAALAHFGRSAHYQEQASIADVFNIVERSKVNFGVVPIENSTEGMVSTTMDLLETTSLRIVGELELPVEHCLLAREQCDLHNITAVYSHEQAIAQCKHWLKENLPQAKIEAVASNTLGAQMASEKNTVAAIASRVNSELYELKILADGIEDITGNKTRFVVLGDMDVDATGTDKTALLFGTYHRPGGLFQALKHFNNFALDMTRLESRPLKTATWAYSFFVEFLGHTKDKKVAQALIELEKDTTFIKHLGSFPAPNGNT